MTKLGLDTADQVAHTRGLAPAAEPQRKLACSHSALYPGDIRKFPYLGQLLGKNQPADLWVSVRDGDHVFTLRRFGSGGFEPAMFDLASDPHEQRNLYDPSNPEHQAMRKPLEDYKRRLVEGNQRTQAKRLAHDRAPKELKQLGYVE